MDAPLDDCMISLWDLGIRNELFHLIFKLNEKTKIRVKTPFGISDPFHCNRIVKQGCRVIQLGSKKTF